MAGQIAPKNLFDLRPDLKALMLLGKLKSATESILPQSDELVVIDVDLLPATTFLEDSLAQSGPLLDRNCHLAKSTTSSLAGMSRNCAT
jgi:hypothetical protein